MTRDFNKPKHGNSRPSFRDASPNRSRDERSPRPARPRLNRETVDRAWESGAQQQHADYRPRTGGGQQRQQRTRDTSPNQRSTPYGHRNGNNRQYSNREDNYSDSRYRRNPQSGNSHRPYNDNASRSSYYEQERRDGGEQRFSERRDSFRSENRRGSENRRDFGDRDFRENFRRNDHPNAFRGRPQREESSPRWQQRNSARGTERNFNRRSNTDEEQFEGDYEYFEQRDNYRDRNARPTRPAERSSRGNSSPREGSRKPYERNRAERSSRRFDDSDSDVQPERHVTRLPDGRVLKGSRPAQRKNARFWTDISQNTDDLLDTVHEQASTRQTSQQEQEQKTSSAETTSATSRKRRARSASAVTRGKKTTGSSSVPKPSQRGFKWPSQS